MIVIIDNFDSFTYNIVEHYRKRNVEVRVYRNNCVSIDEIESHTPSLIILSPGPKDPASAGISVDVVRHFAGKIPIFGVCLGCQTIAYAFGAKIVRAEKMFHGKISTMTHEGKGVLADVQSPMVQMRYHSLVIDETSLPKEIEVTARSETQEIMAIAHTQYALEGVQFHPESIASVQGALIMDNALAMRERYNTTESTKPSRTKAQESKEGNIQLQNTILNKLLEQQDLSMHEAELLMGWMSDDLLGAERSALVLTALRMKGETVEEISGIARIAIQRARTLPIDPTLPHLIDIVGTGGDACNFFNISTASSFVAAGAGAHVAKHGNRAVSSTCGSADVLEALQVKIDIAQDKMASVLTQTGMCFMFAPLYHPAMKHISPVRKALKIRTVFNILGPLINPAHVPHMLLGVYDMHLLDTMAQVLVTLGITRALVVCAERGADEMTLHGVTHVVEIHKGMYTRYEINGRDYFKDIASLSEDRIIQYMRGGTARENAQLLYGVLEGSIQDSMQKRVVESVIALNAGSALYICGVAPTIQEGIARALDSIQSGNAMRVLKHMVSLTNSVDNN